MSNFKTKKLGEFERLGGGTPSTSVKEYWGGDIDWITSASIDEKNNIRYDKKITRLGLENSAAHLIPKNSVIMVTRVGLGKVAVNDRELATSQDCQGILCGDENPFYLMWYIKGIANKIKFQGQGTTISGITVNKLNEFEIKLPKRAIQDKIVEEIESHFSVIEKIENIGRQSLVKSELLRKSILKSSFDGNFVKYMDDRL